MSYLKRLIRETEACYDEVLHSSKFSQPNELTIKSLEIESAFPSRTLVIEDEVVTLLPFTKVSYEKKKMTGEKWITVFGSLFVLMRTSVFWETFSIMIYCLLFRRYYLVITSISGTFHISCSKRKAKTLSRKLNEIIEGI